MSIHPQIIEKDGIKEFAVIPYKEYLAIQEALEDLDDLQALIAAKDAEGDAETIPLALAKEELLRD